MISEEKKWIFGNGSLISFYPSSREYSNEGLIFSVFVDPNVEYYDILLIPDIIGSISYIAGSSKNLLLTCFYVTVLIAFVQSFRNETQAFGFLYDLQFFYLVVKVFYTLYAVDYLFSLTLGINEIEFVLIPFFVLLAYIGGYLALTFFKVLQTFCMLCSRVISRRLRFVSSRKSRLLIASLLVLSGMVAPIPVLIILPPFWGLLQTISNRSNPKVIYQDLI